MALWDKTLLNLQKGYDRITAFASVFSERLKAEMDPFLKRFEPCFRYDGNPQHARRFVEGSDAGSLKVSTELNWRLSNRRAASRMSSSSSTTRTRVE